jgi:chloramphenicol 3-O-phosphotransferase
MGVQWDRCYRGAVDRRTNRHEAFLKSVLEAVGAGRSIEPFVSVAEDAGPVADLLRDIAHSTEPEIRWSVLNGARVDAGVFAADGAEWRVVFGMEGDRLSWLSVHKRPPRFVGIPGGRAVVVNGPSGSGKSSLMEAMAERASTPWVRFDEPILGSAPPGYLIWRDASPTLHESFVAGIATLAAAGTQVVTSSGGHPQAMFSAAFVAVPPLYVGLDCPLPVLLERELGRPGRWGGLAEASLSVHDGWSYDLRLDSSEASSAELADAVLGTVAERQASESPASRR